MNKQLPLIANLKDYRMKYFLCAAGLVLLGCSEQKDPVIGKCYAFNDEAIKIVGVSDNRFYYKHSWNDQDKVFNDPVWMHRGVAIPCGKDGYEFEVLSHSVNRAEKDIEHIRSMVEKIRTIK